MAVNLFTVNGAATQTGRDRKTIGRALRGVSPDGKSGRWDAWLLTTILDALASNGTAQRLDLTAERARLAKAQADVPTAFLADPGMGQYWRSMLPALARRCDSCEHDSVLRAARATFTHFNIVASQCLALKAA